MDNKKEKYKFFLLGFAGIVVLTLLDQLAKYAAVTRLKGTSGKVLLHGVLELQYLENRGMAFGMLQGKIVYFLIFCLLFFLAFLYFMWRVPAETYYIPLCISVTIVAAGALGNFLDRLCRGFVVDFIYFSLIDFPVFNIADVFVVCGGIGLMLLLFFYYKDEDFDFLHLR